MDVVKTGSHRRTHAAHRQGRTLVVSTTGGGKTLPATVLLRQFEEARPNGCSACEERDPRGPDRFGGYANRVCRVALARQDYLA